uniref:Ig-like domain-containing protein n=1 Tax=Xiphophorus couchianus TaxID=32473 RepID=A0A3B5L0Q6_9TELE
MTAVSACFCYGLHCFFFTKGVNSLVPVVTVQLGDPVTLSCAFLEKFQSTSWLHWYKQSAGDTLKFIVLQQKSIKPNYQENASTSRIAATNDDKFSNLTIMKTVLQDEGMYHCAHMDWTASTWTGTYLSVKGKELILYFLHSDPARPTDSETLQCSVVSQSEDKACSGELSVFWFRTGSGQSYPEIIHSTDKGLRDCENTATSNTQKKCSYSFSKNFSSSDKGTFYCAVATCGEILFGKGIKTAGKSFCTSNTYLFISMTVNIGFICHHTRRSWCGNTVNGQDLNYAALQFDERKTSRGNIKRHLKTEDSVYSGVKCDLIIK